MKKFLFLALLLSLSSFALADTVTIDFEQLPEFTQVTNQYSALGATFTNALQLVEPDYNFFDFPPHSGLGVVTNDPDDPMMVNFSLDVRSVSGWYAAPDGIVADAFDSHGNLLTSFVGMGVDGSNLQFVLNSPGTPIAWITISANPAEPTGGRRSTI